MNVSFAFYAVASYFILHRRILEHLEWFRITLDDSYCCSVKLKPSENKSEDCSARMNNAIRKKVREDGKRNEEITILFRQRQGKR
jgi:hypothetical protein